MACTVAIAPDGIAQAQVVERNLPPEPPRRASAIKIGTDDLLRSDDATPLGVNVQAIVLIGENAGAKPASGVKGVDVSQVSGLDAAALREQLTPFVDRPLSRKLIAEVQAAVAAAYREAGRPFVSVTLPPQEVSSGVLQLRVIVFKVAGIKVTGAAADSYPPSRIRLVPGQEIDARKLETDLDWANRNPFRQVEAVFGPGKDLGLTDVNIQVTDRKPWQVYAGYANSGTRLTDRNRYYVGASGAPSADVFASYQLTGSGNFWADDGLFSRPDDAKYVSQAGRVLTPLGLRTSLEVVGDHVLTNERPNNLFRIKTQTSQASAIVRTALSGLLPSAVGDLLGGVELKHQLRTTIFDGTPVAEGSADVAQLVVGWNGRWSDNLGTNTLDVRFKSNPGGILTGNNSLAWSAFTNGRVTDVQHQSRHPRVWPRDAAAEGPVAEIGSVRAGILQAASGHRTHRARRDPRRARLCDRRRCGRPGPDPAQLALRLDAQHALLDAGHAGAVPARRRRVGAGSVFPARLHAVVGRSRTRLCGRHELQFQAAGGQSNDRRAAYPRRILARVGAGVGKLLRFLQPRRLKGIKNKAVDAIYRQRPCQPRILKSAHAIR